jgi:hypothetical protein
MKKSPATFTRIMSGYAGLIYMCFGFINTTVTFYAFSFANICGAVFADCFRNKNLKMFTY